MEGLAPPSLAQTLLLHKRGKFDDTVYENWVKWVAGSLYAGGGKTACQVYAAVMNFIWAMAINPEKQARTQAEINHVIGTGRFPVIADYKNLLYLEVVIKETLCWHPIILL
ncbi:hypothetical protein H0H81_004240, partial [Sphagnurus paluster]